MTTYAYDPSTTHLLATWPTGPDPRPAPCGPDWAEQARQVFDSQVRAEAERLLSTDPVPCS